MAVIKLHYIPPTIERVREQGIAPKDETLALYAKSVSEIREEHEAAGRACWEDLFRNVSTESELSEWEGTIPHYGCDCKNFYRGWKRDNAPMFPLPFDWKYQLKTSVNAKLGHANLSLDEAKLYWAQD